MAEYIERKLACRAVEGQCVDGKMWGNEEYEGTLIDAYEAVDAIDAIPAADVAPVVHGRWEKRGCSWYCTCCGNGYRITCGTIPASRHKYCPNCGAKMDDKTEEP